MVELKRILIPTDFSDCARQAFDQALLIANSFQADLHVLHAVILHQNDPYNPAYHFPESEGIAQRLEELASTEMTSLVHAYEDRPLEISQARERGVAAGPVILDYARAHEIDLIVMGTHGRRGARRLLLGSVTEEVMRFATCPILTVGERSGTTEPEAMGTILCAVDFSDNSRSALATAADLAERQSAELHVAHVVESRHFPELSIPASESAIARAAKLEGVTEVRLRQFCDDAVPGPSKPTLHVSIGRSVPQLCARVEAIGADLLVAGSQGFSPLENLVFGSTAEGLVRRAACPVLTVKSPGA